MLILSGHLSNHFSCYFPLVETHFVFSVDISKFGTSTSPQAAQLKSSGTSSAGKRKALAVDSIHLSFFAYHNGSSCWTKTATSHAWT